MAVRDVVQAAAGVGGNKLYVEDVFSTYLYTGNGSTQTITNGIDLAGEGGLVWIKGRDDGAHSHCLYDTERGVTKQLNTNYNSPETVTSSSPTEDFVSFNSNGFSLGAPWNTGNLNSTAMTKIASWTFRKAPKFFDVVTYTGNGSSSQQIAHNLGSAPGAIFIKRTDSTSNWVVQHRYDNNYIVTLNTTNAREDSGATLSFNSSTFKVVGTGLVNTNNYTNVNGATYVAYLFAHDAGGFGDDGDQSVIKCGSYTGNGSTTGPSVTLDWEPQWIMIKRASGGTGNWMMFDNMRGMSVGGSSVYDDYFFYANTSAAESYNDYIIPNATGFSICNTTGDLNANGSTYIYIAIRRGPMKTPETGTSVYNAITRTGTGSAATISTVGFPPDWVIPRARTGVFNWWVTDRLRGPNQYLSFDQTSAEGQDSSAVASYTMDGFSLGSSINVNESGRAFVNYAFRRAPGFFDEVCYNGTSVAHGESHNLGVVPEMMIVKSRTDSLAWYVYHKDLGPTQFLILNSTATAASTTGAWNDTAPTASVFTVGTDLQTNYSLGTYIAYLFASCPGVSKVGSYTGTGTTQQINCGFTAGARFVLIKRTDSTGDWYVWDSARGIVAGNDPYLLLNSTAAEVTTTDYIDPVASGFEISSTAPAAINASGGSFVFLAIA